LATWWRSEFNPFANCGPQATAASAGKRSSEAEMLSISTE
jgi:hypothetical protein